LVLVQWNIRLAVHGYIELGLWLGCG